MAVSKTTSNHSFQVLLPNIALCTFVAYLKALSWGVGGSCMAVPRIGRNKEKRPMGGGGRCPLKYGWMRVKIQDKQFTNQKRWDTEPQN